MAKNMVSISLEEYKDLLLKDRPTTHEKEVVYRIEELLKEYIIYTDSEWRAIVDNMDCEKEEELIKEIVLMIKYLDREMYMRVWNNAQNKERERVANEMKAKQMREAKEIKNEQSNNN